MKNLEDWYDDALYWTTPEDIEAFALLTKHLPSRADGGTFHAGAHAVASFRMAINIVEPRRVLEIGFNLGHSASIMLGLDVPEVVSLEISEHPNILLAARRMSERWGDRFEFIHRPGAILFDAADFDMIFIDGGHEFADVSNDIGLGQSLGIPWFLFDDWTPRYGPGVAPAIAASDLIPVAIFGNLVLCRSKVGLVRLPDHA